MPFSARSVGGSLVLCLFVPTLLQAGGIPAKTLKDLKAATVYIKVEFVPASGKGKPVPVTGSGFLFRVDDGVGYIATNNHVISPLAGEVLSGPVQVVFHSGLPAEKTVEARVMARDAVRDLAILKVNGVKDLARPLTIDPAVEVGETMPVYAIGFPFGGALGFGKKNPALTITKGTVSSLRHDQRGQVKLVQIDAEINSGNSGGPVVNDKGSLVGVAVSKFVNARTVGFAIPLTALMDMTEGKVASAVFDTLWVVKNQAEVSIEAGLIDPFGKLKDAAIHYRVIQDESELPPDNQAPERMKGGQEVWLKMTHARGQGRFTLKGGGADKVTIAYQASYVTATGKTVFSPVCAATIDLTHSVHSDRLSGDDLKDARGRRYKIYPLTMKQGKHYILDMRADPKDLDPVVMVQDAAGTTLAEDDGSGGLFDALLVFSPPRDGDYQIIAAAGKGAGPFTLHLRQDSGREPGAKGLNLAGSLKAAPSLDPALQVPQHSVNLVLKKGKSYTIDVKSKEFDPLLRLDNMSKITVKSEDLGGGGHSTLYFTPFQDGIYRLTTQTFDTKVGAYDMTVREMPPPRVLDLGANGLKLAGMLAVTDALDVINGRTGRGRCKVYPVKLKAGQKYQIDMTSNQFDSFLRVEAGNGKELAFDDDSGGDLNARIIFTAPAEGVFRIIATQFELSDLRRLGNFELSVTPIR